MGTSRVPPPSASRLALAETADRSFPLDQLACHVAAVSAHQRRVYLERRANGYAWSFAHAGGPYPLLREVASFVGRPYTQLHVATRAAGERWCVMVRDVGDTAPERETWAVIEFARRLTAAVAERRIRDALGVGDSES